MIHTSDLFCSSDNFSEEGTSTDGNKFEAGLAGRDEHLFQKKGEGKRAMLGHSGSVLLSGMRSKLLSPSNITLMPIFLKHKPCNKLLEDEPPLRESKPFPLWLPNPIDQGGAPSERSDGLTLTTGYRKGKFACIS